MPHDRVVKKVGVGEGGLRTLHLESLISVSGVRDFTLSQHRDQYNINTRSNPNTLGLPLVAADRVVHTVNTRRLISDSVRRNRSADVNGQGTNLRTIVASVHGRASGQY